MFRYGVYCTSFIAIFVNKNVLFNNNVLIYKLNGTHTM